MAISQDSSLHEAIILVAARASRPGELTTDRPKGMALLDGKHLLTWQIEAMNAAGIGDIHIVNGYRQELVETLKLHTIQNPEWDKTNMVASLLCAADSITGQRLSAIQILDMTTLLSLLIEHGKPVHGLKQMAIGVKLTTRWVCLWPAKCRNPAHSKYPNHLMNSKGTMQAW